MSELEFIKNLEDDGIFISNEQLEKFRKYADFLLEYNKVTNLTAIRDKNSVYLKHFYDSIILAKYINLNDMKLLDIGSGAGFPGVPLKIIFPKLDLFLMDSNGKKTKFLELLKEKLDLNYTVICDRAEKFIENNREIFDIVCARAVTSMPVLAELSLPFVKIGGKFIAYKGKIDDTLEDGLVAISSLGGNVNSINTFKLPELEDERSLIIVVKICKTDAKYPRAYEKIIKNPLKKKLL